MTCMCAYVGIDHRSLKNICFDHWVKYPKSWAMKNLTENSNAPLTFQSNRWSKICFDHWERCLGSRIMERNIAETLLQHCVQISKHSVKKHYWTIKNLPSVLIDEKNYYKTQVDSNTTLCQIFKVIGGERGRRRRGMLGRGGGKRHSG